MRFSIKIRSSEAKCHCSSNSSCFTSSSARNKSKVWSVERRSISETPIKLGLLFSITQPSGEIEVSQAVNAKSASMVLSGETPLGRWILISTLAAVLSSIFLILIFPLSFAFKMESINDEVVVEKGIWLITSVCLSSWEIRARTRIFPPLRPSL